MRLVLLCGGTGSRLKPLSNGLRSKLFLDLLPSGNGERESMIARLARQLQEAGFLQSAVFVTHREQAGMLRSRIGDGCPIIAEPERRGTLMAAALAAAYCRSVLGDDPDKPMCLLPADSLVDDAFFRRLSELPGALDRTGANIALVGTDPQAPTDRYGYIVPEGPLPAGEAAGVVRFAEKPDREAAAALIRSGALWNCGVFAFRQRYLHAQMAARGLPFDYETLLRRYEAYEADSFDREIAEREPHAVVVRHDGLWKDLGGWDAFTSFLGAQVVGPGSVSDDSLNTHVVNELHLPLHVVGVSGIVAAAGPDGIVIADKRSSDRVKRLPLFPQPMLEEDEKSSRRVLFEDAPAAGTPYRIALIRLKAGAARLIRAERGVAVAVVVVSGEGRLTCADGSGETHRLHTGDAIRLPAGSQSRLEASAAADFSFIELRIISSAHNVRDEASDSR